MMPFTALADAYQRAVYEAPYTVACGPEIAAVLAGFAVCVAGQYYLTPAGERYLEGNQE